MTQPLDPFSEVVDERRRWTPDWYSWLRDNTGQSGVVTGGGRELLTAARTYFVAPATSGGSDSNTGLSAGAPFLTIQKAVDTVYGKLDLNGFNVTIQLATGTPATYSGAISVLFPQVGAGAITINGDNTNPANTIVTSSGVTLVVQRFSTILVANLQIQTTGQYCLFASQNGLILGNHVGYPRSVIPTPPLPPNPSIIFGAATQGHMFGGTGGMVDLLGAPTIIAGNSFAHARAENNGIVRITASRVSIPANRTFNGAFAFATNLSYVQAQQMVFDIGGGVIVTGKKYDSQYNSVISTNGGPVLPGTVAGTTLAGGQFN